MPGNPAFATARFVTRSPAELPHARSVNPRTLPGIPVAVPISCAHGRPMLRASGNEKKKRKGSYKFPVGAYLQRSDSRVGALWAVGTAMADIIPHV